MTLRQMSRLKRWQVEHREHSPLEYHAWDAMLTLWILGWLGWLPALLLDDGWVLPLCGLMYLAPGLYVALRRRLHDSGRLRCDWLPAVMGSPP